MTVTSTKWRVLAVAALVMLTAGALNAPGRTAASSHTPTGATSAAAASHRPAGSAAATRAHATAALPTGFELNRGQTDRRVTFLAHGGGYTLFLTATEAVLNVTTLPAAHARTVRTAAARPMDGDVVRLRLVGANAHAVVSGLDRLPGASNYLLGHKRSQWRTGVQSYARVSYRDIYHGVNLVYHGAQRQLEYDFVLAPGVSPTAIKLDVLGARGLRLDRVGNLVLRLPNGDLSQARPIVYQQVRGRRVAVSGRYALLGHGEVGFAVGRHDTHAPLVIDPVLSYATYLGGGADSSDSAGNAIAVDNAGDAYVTGYTTSTSFPTTTGAYSATNSGATDAFVTKLNPTGTILYSTYLGGNDTSAGDGVAVDSAGDAYIAGTTSATDFPTTTGAYSSTAAGSSDAFVTELNASGTAPVYSTLLGGNDVDSAAAIALAGPGKVYVTGSTSSADFPTTRSYRAADNNGAVFVAGLNTGASGKGSLVYSTLLGSHGFDTGAGIAVNSAGDAYVTGSTDSTGFPFTTGAYSTTNSGGSDAFVTELDATGVISYSTYLGGGGDDHGQAIAVNSAGNAYVTGSTGSANFPQANPLNATGAGCNNPSGNDGVDAFVTELNPAGSALVYSTYLGGSGTDAGYGIAIDGANDAYVTGSTTSASFPTTTDAYTTTNSGGADAFVTKLNAAGHGLLYSTYLGGGSDDTGYGIAANSTGAYVTGQTYSSNFPTTTGAADGANSGSSSAFVARITGTAGETGGGTSMSTSTPAPTCTPLPPTGTATAIPPTATPAPASLRAYYTFDNTPNDSSGNGHTGALKGAATYVSPGKVGAAALGVDGSAGTFFDVPGQVLDTRQSYSVAAWVNLNAIGDNFQTFACIEGNNVCTFYLQIVGDAGVGHKFAMAVENSDSTGGGGVRAVANFVPNTNTWYHLTGVYDAAAGQIRIYVNGQLQASAPYTTPFQGTKDTVIGRGEFGGPGDYVNGKIDDVHFYQGVLTDAQIAQLAGVPVPTATSTTIPTATPANTATSGPVSTPATPSTAIGALQGSQDAAPASANLTTEGTADWIEWGDKPAGNANNDYTGDYNRKANVTPQISTFNPVGYGTESQSGGGGTVLTWSDGTPAQSGTNNGQGVYVSGNGNNPPSSGSGFQFKVSADTSTRELRVYVDASKARGRLTASLSDNSGPVYSDDSLSSTSGTTAGVYTLYYRATSPGQTLTVDWETAVDYAGGGVVLEAATLQQATAIPPTSTATPIPPTVTPVPLALNAFYKFDEGSGTTANDSSGNGHTGTLQGNAGYAAPGQDNSPYTLILTDTNGATGNVDVPEAVINTAESYSVGAWVNLNDTNGFHTAVSIDGQHISAFFLQYCGQCGTFAFAAPVSDADNPASIRAQATIGTPKVGQWYYLTGVYDAAKGVIKLYVDGILQDTQPYFGAFQATGHTAIGRGRFNDNPVDFFPGRIDEVRLYQGVLSDAQIAALAGVGANTQTPTATGTAVAGTATGTATGTTVPGTATSTTTAAPSVTGTTTAAPSVTGTTTAVPSATSTSTSAPTATSTTTAAPSATSTGTTAPSATSTTAPTMTNTAVPPTMTNTAVPPTMTNTAIPPTSTSTAVPATATNTAVPPTGTPTPLPVCQLYVLPAFDTVPRGGAQALLLDAAPDSAITLTVRAKYPASATLYTDSSLGSSDGFGVTLRGAHASGGGYRYTFHVAASGLALLTFAIPHDARQGTVTLQIAAQEPCGLFKTVTTFQVHGTVRGAARATGAAVTLAIPLPRGDTPPANAGALVRRGILRVTTQGHGATARRVLRITYHTHARPAAAVKAGAVRGRTTHTTKTGAGRPRPHTLFGVAVGTGT